MTVPLKVARVARELRTPRRTASGLRERPWVEIADEVLRQGLGKYDPGEIADAVAALGVEEHPLHHRSPEELARLEQSFRDGWAADFPDEPWPGLDEARRRLRERAAEGLDHASRRWRRG